MTREAKAPTEWEGEVVAHAEELAKADDLGQGELGAGVTLSSGWISLLSICCRVNLTVSSLWEATITPTCCKGEVRRVALRKG